MKRLTVVTITGAIAMVEGYIAIAEILADWSHNGKQIVFARERPPTWEDWPAKTQPKQPQPPKEPHASGERPAGSAPRTQ